MLRFYSIFFLLFFCIAFAKAQDETSFVSLTAYEFRIELLAYDNAVIIDTRPKSQYKKSRISGAISAQNPETLEKIIDKLDKDQTLFVYSKLGVVSITPCIYLKDMGFEKVYNLENGFRSWQDENYPIDDKRILFIKRD